MCTLNKKTYQHGWSQSLLGWSVLASSVLLTSCGSLGSDPDFQPGFYVAGGVGISRLEPDTSKNSTYDVDETASAGGQFALGYDLTSRISIEGHVADLGEATLTPNGSIGYEEMGLSGLFYGLNDQYDRNERIGFSGYGRVGVGAMKNDAGNVPFERLNDVSLLAGVGVEYGFRFGLALRGEIIAFDKDAQYAQLGLVYRLGDREVGGRSAPNRSTSPAAESPVAVPEAVALPEVAPMSMDNDQDGVRDSVDQCLTTPIGRPVDSSGCEIFNGALEGVNFETGSDRLTDQAKVVLSEAAATLQSMPEIRVLIEAHTDNQGSATSNLDLSKRRALSVARYLVAQGVAANRIQPQAFGESKPRASNGTAEGRRQNRRVEFKVLDS